MNLAVMLQTNLEPLQSHAVKNMEHLSANQIFTVPAYFLKSLH